MDALWVGLGIVVLAVTLLDVFLTALNYDEAGFFAGRLAALQWMLTRRVTRRMARRWRPLVLRQVTGLQIMVTVIAWVGGVILGYGLIYLGYMQGSNFQYSGVNGGFFGAMYFSAAQLATVGTSQLSPNTDLLRALSILETLTGVVLVSLILTFLLGIYDVISSLRALSAQFFSAGAGVGEPIASLKPYFPGGESRDLDSHLESISDSFGSYTDGVRLHHSAYYFQSGRDTFSLPYSIRMLAGIIGGLRWGLPGTNPVTQEPTLQPLTAQFEKFQQYMHPLLKWQSTEMPETVTADAFAAQLQAEASRPERRRSRRARRKDPGDPWVARFVQVNHEMAELTGTEPLTDPVESYARYVQWLPFAYHAQQFSAAVSRDLDYQPVYAAAEDQAPAAVLAPSPDETAPRSGETGLRAFIRRRVTLIDPGYTRLISASRALGASVLAVAVLAVGLNALGQPPLPTAIFGGMIAMFTGAASPGGHGWKRLAGLAAVVPVLFAIALNVLVPHEPIPSALVLAALAFVGVAASRFGRQLGGLGQLAFVSYYFSLLLNLQPAEFLPFVAAALVGVLCSVLIQLIPNRGAHARVVRGGVRAFEQRVVRSLEPLIDTVSAARWDPDLQRRTRSEFRQTHHTAAFLSGQLSGRDPDLGLSVEQADALRIRVHDTELALANLGWAARAATGSGIPIEVRARLAGALQSVQKHITGYPADPAWASTGNPAGADEAGADEAGADEAGADQAGAAKPEAERLPSPIAPQRWPRPARRVYAAAFELQRASDELHSARSGDLVISPADVEPAPEPEAVSDVDALLPGQKPEGAGQEGLSPHHQGPKAAATAEGAASSAALWRRAVQASLSTGIALYLGSFVSSTHQFWAAMPAYQAIGGSDGETFVKGTQKIIGTIAGATVGFGIAISAGSHPAVLLPVLALCVFASAYFRAASSPLATFWQTMMFAQLYEFLGRLSTEAIDVRIVETVIGAVVALLVAALVLPTRTRTKFANQALKLVDSVEGLTASALQVWKSGRPASAADLATLSQGEIATTEQLRALQATAVPLQHSAGVFEPSGVESQLSAFWELLYYTRHFVSATERGHPESVHVSPEQWGELEESTERNFAALAAAFDARSPGPVDPEIGIDELGDEEEPRTAEEALRALARANQAIALMVEDAVPQPSGLFHRHSAR